MAIHKDLLDRLLEGRDPSEQFARDGLLDDLKKAEAAPELTGQDLPFP